MKLRPQFFLSLAVLIFFVYFVWEARGWRLQARLYPWAIGIPMILLTLVQLVLELRGLSDNKPEAGDVPMDFQFDRTVEGTVARARAINIFLWIVGFFAAIYFVGFSVSVALLLFFYLKVQSGEPWIMSVMRTGGGWLFFWALFDRLLHLPFPDGQLFLWLGL